MMQVVRIGEIGHVRAIARGPIPAAPHHRDGSATVECGAGVTNCYATAA